MLLDPSRIRSIYNSRQTCFLCAEPHENSYSSYHHPEQALSSLTCTIQQHPRVSASIHRVCGPFCCSASPNSRASVPLPFILLITFTNSLVPVFLPRMFSQRFRSPNPVACSQSLVLSWIELDTYTIQIQTPLLWSLWPGFWELLCLFLCWWGRMPAKIGLSLCLLRNLLLL